MKNKVCHGDTLGKEIIMKKSETDGIYYDYNESHIVKIKNILYNDFCKCCEQEGYSYEVLSQMTDYVICRADNHIIEFFIECMKSENKETIKMLCTLPKSMLVNRINDIHFKEESEKWIETVDSEAIKEAILRYDEPQST